MRTVLFVCHHNAGRSQMAAAFFERAARGGWRAVSAGSTPTERVWPLVVDAMREVGVDLADRRPQLLTRVIQDTADVAVTMGCGDACPYVRGPVEAWDVPDPAGVPLERVREIRDELERRVGDLVRRLEGET
jgi:protein-tyrosine-phosphatase